jgi:hypothetical protein
MTPLQKAVERSPRKVVWRLAVTMSVGVTMSLLAVCDMPAEVRMREVMTVVLVIVTASLTSYLLDRRNKGRPQERKRLRVFAESADEED